MLTRRGLLSSLLGGAIVAGAAMRPHRSSAGQVLNIVVLGAGAGGRAFLQTLLQTEKADQIRVILIEPQPQYFTPYFSNQALSGHMGLEAMIHTLPDWSGIKHVAEPATGINRDKQQVRLARGGVVPYDLLVASPGVSFIWDQVEGLSEATVEDIPHAWAGHRQMEVLQSQLRAMPEDGTFVMSIPSGRYRCPPAPYERACLVAAYCKRHKPDAQILLLDEKEDFTLQGVFEEAWYEHYDGMVEWVPHSLHEGVQAVDVASKTLILTDEEIEADVFNYIPPQRAHDLLVNAGLADDTGYCPVEPFSFRSHLDKKIFVLGDSALTYAMSRSASSAMSQGHSAAMTIRSEYLNEETEEIWLTSICWARLADEDGALIAAVYRLNDQGELEAYDPKITVPEEDVTLRRDNVKQGLEWYYRVTNFSQT